MHMVSTNNKRCGLVDGEMLMVRFCKDEYKDPYTMMVIFFVITVTMLMICGAITVAFLHSPARHTLTKEGEAKSLDCAYPIMTTQLHWIV